jgi:succinate dehydrogenase / fumarate reductase iron-sulfur subunit
MAMAGKIHFTDALPWVDNVPKSKNLDEIQKLIEISMTNKL